MRAAIERGSTFRLTLFFERSGSLTHNHQTFFINTCVVTYFTLDSRHGNFRRVALYFPLKPISRWLGSSIALLKLGAKKNKSWIMHLYRGMRLTLSLSQVS